MGPGQVTCSGPLAVAAHRQVTLPGPLWAWRIGCDCVKHTGFDPNLDHAHACGKGSFPTEVHDALVLCLCTQARSLGISADMEVATGEVIVAGQARERKDADVYIKQNLPIPGLVRNRLAIDVKTHGATNNRTFFDKAQPRDFLPSNLGTDTHPPPHLKHMTSHAKGIVNQRKERQQANTDFTIYAMDSFGGTTKHTDEVLMGLANAGSMKGHWEGKAAKLCRKLQTMQSVVMARTYADKASLRVSELLLRQGNRNNPSASAAPVCFSLETALANLNAISY